jgi:predicted ferric reductase
VAAHIAIWTLALVVEPTLIPARQLAAESLSSLAIVCMSANLMLSTRTPALERGLHGLDKLFVTHRTIGLSVAFLVSAHFLLVPKSIGYVPSKPVGYTAIALVLAAVFAASAPRFPWRRLVPLRYQDWKLSHRFMGVVVALAVTHSLLAHTYVRSAPLLTAYVYTIAALGLIAWLYRELLFAHVGPFRTFRVRQSRALGDGVTEITLGSTSTARQRTAGQFAFVALDAGPSREQHPFTISSGAEDDVRFSIKASGDFTKQLQSGVPEASSVRVEGPYGAFGYRRGGPHQLWLAGGIGITPFLAMADNLDERTSVQLVWSIRDARDAIYQQELTRITAEKTNLRLVVHSTSQLGHVDIGALTLDAEPRDFSVFICGPVPMRQGFIKQLKALGVPRNQIHFEEFRLR